MKVFRWLAAGLLWILAGVVGLLGGLLCVTVILLPIGIPLLLLARKLGATAGRLMLPKAVRHPVEQARGKAFDAGSDTAKGTRRFLRRTGKEATQATPSTRKMQRKLKKSTGKVSREAGKKLGRR
jgi:hypothetical protein